MKERSILELLMILQKEFIDKDLQRSYYKWDGLCQCVMMLYTDALIDIEECNIIDEYIQDNFPEGLPEEGDGEELAQNWYFWKPKDEAPRLEWLDKHIKLNTK